MLARGHVADREHSCRLFVAEAGCEKPQHFQFARRANGVQSQVIVFLRASGLSRK